MCWISAGPGNSQRCGSEIINFQVSEIYSKVNTHRDEYCSARRLLSLSENQRPGKDIAKTS